MPAVCSSIFTSSIFLPVAITSSPIERQNLSTHCAHSFSQDIFTFQTIIFKVLIQSPLTVLLVMSWFQWLWTLYSWPYPGARRAARKNARPHYQQTRSELQKTEPKRVKTPETPFAGKPNRPQDTSLLEGTRSNMLPSMSMYTTLWALFCQQKDPNDMSSACMSSSRQSRLLLSEVL